MAEGGFPKRHNDGSFQVVCRFVVSDKEVISLMQDYLNAWVRANNTWTRIWRSDKIEEEVMSFYSEFFSGPHLKVINEEGVCSIILHGRPSARRWKDWAIFIVNDISNVFPEIKFERFES